MRIRDLMTPDVVTISPSVASVADELSWEVDNTKQHRLTPPTGGSPPSTR